MNRVLLSLLMLITIISSSCGVQEEEDICTIQIENIPPSPIQTPFKREGGELTLNNIGVPIHEIIKTQQEIIKINTHKEADEIIYNYLKKWNFISPEIALLGTQKGSGIAFNKLCNFSDFKTDYPLHGITHYVETGKPTTFCKDVNSIRYFGYGLTEPMIQDMPVELSNVWRRFIELEKNSNVHFIVKATAKGNESSLCRCPYPIQIIISDEESEYAFQRRNRILRFQYTYFFNLRNREDYAVIFIHFQENPESVFPLTNDFPILFRIRDKKESIRQRRTFSIQINNNFSMIFSKSKIHLH